MPLPAVIPILGGLGIRALLTTIARFLIGRLWLLLLLVVDWFKGSSLKTVAVLILILKAIGPLALVGGVALYMLGGLDGLAAGLITIAAQLESVANQVQAFPLAPWLAFANRAFPLDLALLFLGILLTVRLVSLGLRFIKSLIAGLGS